MAITLYKSGMCPYCVSAARFLRERKKVPFTEIDLTDDSSGRDALVRRTGRRTVPQIFIGDVHVGGYDDLRELDARGGLDPLLVPYRTATAG